MMDQKQRDTLLTSLTEVFGRVDDDFVDSAVELMNWLEIQGGETLLRQGDPSAGVYFVISGRLRAVVEKDGQKETVGEIGRGETVGEMSVLLGEPHNATIIAIRDTMLAHASPEAVAELLRRYPQLSIHMARIISKRSRQPERHIRKPGTICILPLGENVDAAGFAEKLVPALDRWGVATLETKERIDSRFGAGAACSSDRASESYQRVSVWLEDVEFWNEFVVLLADDTDTEWTRRCLRRADEVLLVVNADTSPELRPIERLCSGDGAITGAHQTLVLLHDARERNPSGTAKWLDPRPVESHVHVRPSLDRDIARLARILTGNAIGLVFAGGGARGFAHLGVYKALEEAGIQIDFVGGTSVGGSMAGYVSLDQPAEDVTRYAKKAFSGNPTSDLNFVPLLSLIQGKRVRRQVDGGVLEGTGSLDSDVADNWRTMFCVASSYSDAREVVITRGRMGTALRASLSIPVALPPTLWQGELLIDGAIFNNFPTDVMARMGARRIIGVDVSRRVSRRYEFEELPGTWQLLWDRLRGRRRRRYRLPGIGAILMGTTILYSESRSGQARKSVDLYFNPDLTRIGLLDWNAFDRVVEIGYQHAKEVLRQMTDEELAPYRNETPAVEMQELTA